MKPVPLFVTPEDMKDLEERLDSLKCPNEKSIAWIAAMMGWNLACKIVNDEAEQKKANKLEFIQQAAKDMIASQSTGE